MWDLETMHNLNNQPKAGEKVSSDGRVCTNYHSRPKRFYVDSLQCLPPDAYVVDIIAHQGYGSFGPMPETEAERLCEVLNNLTKV